MPITTKTVAVYFKRSGPTVRNWAKEFADYLSPTGSPEAGKVREFTVEDMKVFDLIAKMKDQGKTYDEIHASLKMGARGNPPDLDESDLEVLQAAEGERRVALEVQALQQVIVDLRRQLSRAQETAAQAEIVRLENRELKTSLRYSDKEREDLKKRLDTAQSRIEALSKQLGEEYVRGVMDTLQRVGHLPAEQGNHKADDA